MNDLQKQDFVRRMGKRRAGFARGGAVKRTGYTAGGAITGASGGASAGAAIGSAIPGIGTAVGGLIGGIGGFISGLFGGGPQMPNITDPVTGAQITDAAGRVVASQDQLKAFATTLQGANGIGAQQAALGHLQDIASGKGPNPAAAALAQNTGANVANQAALAAGQRGAGANVGLIARQAAQTGAGIQQAAVGQAATLEAQQELGAINSMGTLGGQIVGEQQGALNASNAAALNNQGQILGAQGTFQNTVAGAQGNVNTNNTSLANAALPVAADLGKGALSGIGASQMVQSTPGGGGSGSDLLGAPKRPGETLTSTFARGGKVVEGPHKSHVANYLAMAMGGKVAAKVSPGEIYLSPEKVEQVLEGANPLKMGEKIPGKAKVRGDSTKNDTVPRNLEEGGIVIPRTHTMSEEKAALFVHRSAAKKGRR